MARRPTENTDEDLFTPSSQPIPHEWVKYPIEGSLKTDNPVNHQPLHDYQENPH